jgi:acyl-CoA thioesterase I
MVARILSLIPAIAVVAMSLADPPIAVAAAQPARILAFGDSLTAGYGLPPEDAFPVQLQNALNAAGYTVAITNAGVSGDTTADGRARIDWSLADPFDYAIVELGANDALRGLDPGEAYANLDAILNALAAKHVKVLLAGMYAPRNLGHDYVQQFDAIYSRLITAHPDVALYPFFLDGVALHPELIQGDGLHPNAQGVGVIVKAILPAVERLLGAPPVGAPPKANG